MRTSQAGVSRSSNCPLPTAQKNAQRPKTTSTSVNGMRTKRMLMMLAAIGLYRAWGLGLGAWAGEAVSEAVAREEFVSRDCTCTFCKRHFSFGPEPQAPNPLPTRMALSTTATELSDMPIAAAHGGMNPSAASGRPQKLYAAAQTRFCLAIFIVRRAVSIARGNAAK